MEQYALYSIDEARTTVVVGDLHGMCQGNSSVNVNFYDPTATTTASARETVLSNARLRTGTAWSGSRRASRTPTHQVVVGSTETLPRARHAGRMERARPAARCAGVDMASYKDALEVSTPELTRLLLRR